MKESLADATMAAVFDLGLALRKYFSNQKLLFDFSRTVIKTRRYKLHQPSHILLHEVSWYEKFKLTLVLTHKIKKYETYLIGGLYTYLIVGEYIIDDILCRMDCKL